jgi:two-component system, cell cycle sensor histidine kinase and response regulator CckA
MSEAISRIPAAAIPQSKHWISLLGYIEMLSAAGDFEHIIKCVREHARRISQADGASFVLRDGDQCYYIEEDAAGPLWKGRRFPMAACISGWCMIHRKTAVIPNVYDDPRIPHDIYRPTFVKSLIMVPIRTADPMGAIGFYWAKERSFDPETIMILEAFARSTATAITSVGGKLSLENRVRERTAELESVNARLNAEILERSRTEEHLRQTQRLEAIGKLAGGIAHDFNNLLMVISGAAEGLARKVCGDHETKYLEMISTASKRGVSLTRQLLSFARRQPMAPEPVSLCKFVKSLEEILGRLLRGNIEIIVDTPPQDCVAVADPNELELALLNLATNAQDAMPGGGVLRISVHTAVLQGEFGGLKGAFAVISVSDTGKGIPGNILPYIFDPFFTTKDVGKGTGLGLSQVYGFAKRSEGGIKVLSEAGQGATFTLYLPAAADLPGLAATGAEVKTDQLLATGRILVVEDNADVAKICLDQLEQLGLQADYAASFERAFDFLNSGQSYALVFSDILMPGGKSGLDLARELKRSAPAVRVVLTTGYSESAADAVSEGFTVLRKPYSLQDLKRALSELNI